jgi:hypothetical protein
MLNTIIIVTTIGLRIGSIFSTIVIIGITLALFLSVYFFINIPAPIPNS